MPKNYKAEALRDINAMNDFDTQLGVEIKKAVDVLDTLEVKPLPTDSRPVSAYKRRKAKRLMSAITLFKKRVWDEEIALAEEAEAEAEAEEAEAEEELG